MLQADRLGSDSRLLEHRFRLEALLGRGGCGEVHAAFDLMDQRLVALKLLRPEPAGRDESGEPDSELDESLRAEFRVLRGLAHPGIVRVFDYGRAEGISSFYTMELLEGRDLAAARTDVDPHALVEQVGLALDYLHANGLVHSDLKPSNVFLVGAPTRYVLTDFGLVRRMRMRGSRRQALYGTLAYMPPERLRAQDTPPDAREDLYSLGALLYEVLTGVAPYTGENSDATVAAILDGDLEAELARVPEVWTRLLRRLLEPDPAQRFASAWDLLQAWSAAFDRPAPAPQSWDPPFVARRRELSQVRSALADAAAHGHGALLCAAGLPGVGKSALLEAATAQIVAAGIPCRHFHAPSAPRPLALVEAMAELYRRWQPGLPESVQPAAARLAEWPAALRRAESNEEQLNVHARALADLRSVTRLAPHVLVLDDAHRLDHGSRALLRFMAMGARDIGIVLLVGTRSGTRAADAPSDDLETFADELEQARRAGASVRMLTLRELTHDDVVTLVRRRFGSAPELELLAQRLFDLTQGHPFFVTEALQHLVASGQLRRDKQGWQLAPQTERKLLPRMADTVLSEHIASVRPEDRAVFEALALLPSGAESLMLSRILHEAEARVQEVLARGVHAGLLLAAGEPRRYRFRHELIREACATRCPETTARRYHRQIADAVQGTPAEAHHRLRAGETTRRSRDCFRREAARFEARHAPWEALRYYAAALDIDPQAAEADDLALRVAELRTQVGMSEAAAAMLLQRLAAVRKPLLRARYLHRLGDAYRHQGRNDEALFHLQAASELFQKHAEPEEQRRFAADLVRVLIAKGDYAEAAAQCQEALAKAPAENAAGRAAMLLLQGQAERQGGDYAAAEATCRQALDVLKPLGRTLELAQAYTQIGTSYLYRSEPEQAERFYRAALKVHTELDDLHGLKNAHNNLGLALMRAGRLEEAIAAYERSIDLKRQLGDRTGEGSSLANLGNLRDKRGEHRLALDCYRRGIGIYRRLNRPRELATLYNNMSDVLQRIGRFHAAWRYVERARECAAKLEGSLIAQVVALNRGALLLCLMDHRQSAATLNAALQQVKRSGLVGLSTQFHALLCLAYARAGDPNEAALHDRLAQEGLGRDMEDDARLDVLLDLAEAAEVAAQLDRSESLAREAESIARRTGRSHALVKALQRLAVAGAGRGDWDVAEVLLAEALGLCQSLGFRYELAKCYKFLGKLHWDIGLRSRAEDDFEKCVAGLEALDLKVELGLTYLELARLVPQDGGAA